MIADGNAGRTTAGGPRRGSIMPVGGAEDKRRERVILARFVELAGGERARIAIVPTASSIEGAGQYYKSIFYDLGAASAEVAYIHGRAAANNPEAVEQIEAATGIYITGGNQMRLAAILGGSRVEAAIRARNAAGAVIAGTSAGASILSAHMVAQGAGGNTPKQRMAQMAAGFGLIDGVVIDQHFRERDRIGRLLALVALNPALLGLGIDEDTAAIIDADGVLEVLGRGTVMIVDGARMQSDVAHQRVHRPLSITNVLLHALASGYRYDLRDRRPLPAPPPALSKADRRKLERAGLRVDPLAYGERAADDDVRGA